MKAIKEFLKRILPPPVRTFMREVQGLRALILDLRQELSAQQRQQMELLRQQAEQQRRKAEELEKKLDALTAAQQDMTKALERAEAEMQKQLQQQERRMMQRMDGEKRAAYYDYCCRLPPEEYGKELQLWYRGRTGKALDLKHPKTLNEKIQWLKLHDSTPLKTRLADKYLMRYWVKEKLGEEYLLPLLGVWDSFDEIDFDELPDRFVLKATHGCGYNMIVTDKGTFDKEDAKRKFFGWMRQNYGFVSGFELQYAQIPQKIIAEEYHPCQYEYQFYCFNGIPKFISVIHAPHGENRKATYSLDWKRLDFVTSLPVLEEALPVPRQLEEMTKCAQIMCRDFIFVRVDLFHDGTRFFVNELTFTPANGLMKFEPGSYDAILGAELALPE